MPRRWALSVKCMEQALRVGAIPDDAPISIFNVDLKDISNLNFGELGWFFSFNPFDSLLPGSDAIIVYHWARGFGKFAERQTLLEKLARMCIGSGTVKGIVCDYDPGRFDFLLFM